MGGFVQLLVQKMFKLGKGKIKDFLGLIKIIYKRRVLSRRFEFWFEEKIYFVVLLRFVL